MKQGQKRTRYILMAGQLGKTHRFLQQLQLFLNLLYLPVLLGNSSTYELLLSNITMHQPLVIIHVYNNC